jgi:hypothetical protein
MQTKKLPDVPSDTISKSSWSNLFLDNDSQPMKGILVLLQKEDEVLRRKLPAEFHHPSEILGVGNPFLLSKPEPTFGRDF